MFHTSAAAQPGKGDPLPPPSPHRPSSEPAVPAPPPPPPGSNVQNESRFGAIAGGMVVFGASYGLSAVIGARSDDPAIRYLLIPLAGPIVTIATDECSDGSHHCPGYALRTVTFMLDFAVQGLGLSLIVRGIAGKKRHLVVGDDVGLTVAPMVHGSGRGLALTGYF